MKSLTQSKFEDFPMLIQIVRQNLQNPQSSDCMSLIINKGFSVLLEIVLNDLFPSVLDPQDIFNPNAVLSIFDSFDQKINSNFDVIYPKIKFFQILKNRVLFLDILLSLVLVKKDAMMEFFFGSEQERDGFTIFGKLVIWQVFTRDIRERALIDKTILLLLFNALPEMILTNKTVPFGGANRKLIYISTFICINFLINFRNGVFCAENFRHLFIPKYSKYNKHEQSQSL